MTDLPSVDPLHDITAALRTLDKLVVMVEFDLGDSQSVAAALRSVDTRIDATMAAHRGHPVVEAAIAELKAKCRAQLYREAECAPTKASMQGYRIGR